MIGRGAGRGNRGQPRAQLRQRYEKLNCRWTFQGQTSIFRVVKQLVNVPHLFNPFWIANWNYIQGCVALNENWIHEPPPPHLGL